MEKIAERLVNYQIQRGYIPKEERILYRYGYQILLEYTINVCFAVLIAILFQAYGIVAFFTLAFMPVRSYAGGYHASSGTACVLLSAGMQIAVIVLLRWICSWEYCQYLVLVEILFVPYIFKRIPMPVKNKPMSENEAVYFAKKAKTIYLIECFLCVLLLAIGRKEWAMAVFCAHLVIFGLALRE